MSNNFWKLGPKKGRQFITVNNLIAWGLTQPSISESYTQARNLFQNAANLFNGTQTYTDVDGQTQSYPDLGVTSESLLNHYFEEYGDRLIARPVEVGRAGLIQAEPGSEEFTIKYMSLEDALGVCLDITYRKTQQFVLYNTYKYLGLVRSTGFIYNPIENYRMAESGTDNRILSDSGTASKKGTVNVDYNGNETLSHQIEMDTVSYLEVDAPVTTFNGGFTNDGYKISDVTFSTNTNVDSYDASAKSSQSLSGGTIGTASGGTGGSGQSASIGTDGTTITTKNYTTTMDDANEGRLKDYSTTEGSSGSAESSASSHRETVIATGKASLGNPSAYSYSDKTERDGRADLTTYDTIDTTSSAGTNNLTHNLTRSGNIGVTTSQQMIESERELVNFNVVDQFCKDLNKEILLEVYSAGIPTEIVFGGLS